MNNEEFRSLQNRLASIQALGDMRLSTQPIVEDRHNARSELLEILHQLEDLGRNAAEIMQANFPNSYRQGKAYGAFNFGKSDNPYDTTFEQLIMNLDQEDTDFADDDYREEN